MQKIKDLLRLHLAGGVMSRRQLARIAGCSKTAVSDCLRRAHVAGLSDWLAVEGLDEEELERRLYPSQANTKLKGRRPRPLPDWAEIRAELARRDHQVTLALLWQEYKAQHPDGYQYSQFCDLYRNFEKKLSVVLRQAHRGGEKTFVDFCDGIPLIDIETGELIPTELFVGALGASSYTFATATLSQELPVWLDSHVRMYEYFQGVSALTICDNLRSGVTRPDRYEAEVNATYRDFASHFGTCVFPTRVRKPRDKGKVEAAVLVAQRWILAALRHRRFYHLEEMNAAIAELLEKLNNRVMRHVKQSRRELYERLDRPALKPLPARRYQFAEYKEVKANIDYHIEFDAHYYSVPYTMVGEQFWCRATLQTVELFHKGKRITSHVRSFVKYGYSTLPEHRPASHRAHLEWTPSRLIGWGQKIGPHTAAVVEHVLNSRPHPEQGYRSALGLLRLSNRYGTGRLEKACERSIAIGSAAYRTVKMILKRRMETAPLPNQAADSDATAGLGAANVRGRRYYS
ncbi:MAG TPA: IS21 family transposase [Steroidobacteraceae bacterium]|nr:IS21 family transposase [Steroidobacteraceae bacterium]